MAATSFRQALRRSRFFAPGVKYSSARLTIKAVLPAPGFPKTMLITVFTPFSLTNAVSCGRI